MADNEQKDLSEEQKKQLKKLFDSYTAVLEHKLGRPPTMEELTQELQSAAGSQEGEVEQSEQSGDQPVATEDIANQDDTTAQQAEERQEQTEEAESQAEGEGEEFEEDKEPDIIHYKVYYGMSPQQGEDGEETKQPDPEKVLFYETPNGDIFDTAEQAWLNERPGVMDHLPARPVMFDDQGKDIMRAIINGVVSNDDLRALDSSQMLSDDHRQVWQLCGKLTDLYEKAQELDKSTEDYEYNEESVEAEKPGADQEGCPEGEYITEEEVGTDVTGEFKNTTGADKRYPYEDTGGNMDLPGENIVEKIVERAMAQADERLRQMVVEEVEKRIDALLQVISEEN